MRQDDMAYSNSVKTRKTTQYFTALDGFRGVLAIMIAMYHTMWVSHVNSTPLFNNGPILVDLFFVFSGFLMFTLYSGGMQTAAEGRDFIKRRLARIYPLHFFMLMVALLYAAARVLAHLVGLAGYEAGEILPFQPGATDSIWSFLSNLTLTHSMGLHSELSYNMPSWTVSVEFWTYFVFLGMMLWARPKKAWHFGLLTMLIGANYYVLSTLKPDMNFNYDLGFWRCLGGFFTGVVTAYIYKCTRPAIERYQEKSKEKNFLTLASFTELGALIIMAGFVIYFPGKAQFFIGIIAFIFVFVFAFDMGLISKFLSLPLFRHIAKISYSIYMVHVVISLFFAIFAENIMPNFLGPQWNETQLWGDILLAPYLLCVLACAHFTYKYIEVPGRRVIMRYDFKARLRAGFSKLILRKT